MNSKQRRQVARQLWDEFRAASSDEKEEMIVKLVDELRRAELRIRELEAVLRERS